MVSVPPGGGGNRHLVTVDPGWGGTVVPGGGGVDMGRRGQIHLFWACAFDPQEYRVLRAGSGLGEGETAPP